MEIDYKSAKNESDLKKNTGLSSQEIYFLTGIDVILSYRQAVADPNTSIYIEVNNPVVAIRIRNKDLNRYTEIQYIGPEKIIYNNYFRLTNRREGIGTLVHISQVLHAIEKGYSALYGKSAGGRGDNREDQYDGYVVWLILGYIPHNFSHHIYKEWLKRRNIPFRRSSVFIHEKNIKTTDEQVIRCGRELWEEAGENMDIVFGLKKSSESLNALHLYMERKIIKLQQVIDSHEAQKPLVAEGFENITKTEPEFNDELTTSQEKKDMFSDLLLKLKLFI